MMMEAFALASLATYAYVYTCKSRRYLGIHLLSINQFQDGKKHVCVILYIWKTVGFDSPSGIKSTTSTYLSFR